MDGDVTAARAEILVEPFREELLPDFRRLHSDVNGAGWCSCVAWWVPTWDGWGERSAEQNAALRDDLCRRGEYDGLLAFEGEQPVGWTQVGPRDRLAKLVAQLELAPDPGVWAVTCFLVAPSHRGRGVGRALLAASVEVARAAGATRLEAYPRAGDGEASEQWTGPMPLFERAGFALWRPGDPRAVMSLALHETRA
jgi:GNAT superfamily N-acetyltransferase